MRRQPPRPGSPEPRGPDPAAPRPAVSRAGTGRALAAVVAAVAVVGGAQAASPRRPGEPRPPAATTVAVQSAALVCPLIRQGDAATNAVGVAVPPLPEVLPPPASDPAASPPSPGAARPAAPARADAGAPTGSVRLTSSDAAHPFPATVLDQPSQLAVLAPRAPDAYPLVTGVGTLSAGVVGDVAVRLDAGPNRGLLGASCTPPTTEAWFAGASTAVGRSSVLTLFNVDSLPAVVDVGLGDAKGPVNAPGLVGLIVPPGQTAAVPLQSVAAGSSALLVHVRARAGRVSPQLYQRVAYAGRPGGVDYIPVTTRPEPSAVAPGLPAGDGLRRLVLGNPGTGPLHARVRLVTPDGGFVPSGLDAVSVPPGGVTEVDVTAALRRQAAAVRVDADQPVVLDATADTGPRGVGVGEFAWTGAATALSAPTAVPVTSVGNATSTVSVTAVDGPVRVRLRRVDGAGRDVAAAQQLDVGPDRTAVVQLPAPPPGRPYGLVLEPVYGPGRAYAARELFEMGSRGPLFTIEPVRSGVSTTELRPVQPDPRVGGPR